MYFKNQPIYCAEIKNQSYLKIWREYQDSLTDKLKAATGSAELEVLSQHWMTPSWWDRYVLKLQETSLLQREIMMRSNGIAYWYARSIIPKRCYELNPEFFNRLEKETMRELIFGESKVRRLNHMSYPIDPQCIEWSWVRNYIPTLQGTPWARFAEFSFQESNSFYLLELLLPELESII